MNEGKREGSSPDLVSMMEAAISKGAWRGEAAKPSPWNREPCWEAECHCVTLRPDLDKRSHMEWFHLYGMSGIGSSTGIARGCQGGEKRGIGNSGSMHGLPFGG